MNLLEKCLTWDLVEESYFHDFEVYNVVWQGFLKAFAKICVDYDVNNFLSVRTSLFHCLL